MDQIKTDPDTEGHSNADDSLLDSRDPHCHVFANMRYGYIYCQVVVDKDGFPVDFIHREVNQSYKTLTGLTDVIGRKATEVFPDIQTLNPGFIERHLKVAETCPHYKYVPVKNTLLIFLCCIKGAVNVFLIKP